MLYPFFSVLVHEHLLGETHYECNAHERCQGDEYSIYKVQVQGAQGKEPVAGADTESHRAEWRHQGRGYGYTRNDVAHALATAAQGYDTGQSSAQCNAHVVDGWRGACQKFGLDFVQRGDQEVYGGRGYAEQRCNKVVCCRSLEQHEVVDTHGQSHANDRAHQGGDEHGAYDYCRTIGIEA